MNLAHGGHLTHGHPLNFSGKYFNVVPYGVRKDDERLDYDELASQARTHKPKLIIVGRQRLSSRHRLCAHPRRGRRGRRADDDRHGAHRGPGRRWCPSQPGAALAFRHDDDAQDAEGAARRPGAVPAGAREGPRPRRVPRCPGRAAGAHHRGQGGMPEGGRNSRSSAPISGRSSPTRRAWPASSPPEASASSAAAPTTT